MAFSEVREYQMGDDVRSIDWNVTARTGNPFVKVFEEERELTVMMLVDVSGSGDFGSRQMMKRQMMTEICAVISFSALQNNDKVGVIFFSDKHREIHSAQERQEPHPAHHSRVDRLSHQRAKAPTSVVHCATLPMR
jgi:uncharacterized protein (DUF58 family)